MASSSYSSVKRKCLMCWFFRNLELIRYYTLRTHTCICTVCVCVLYNNEECKKQGFESEKSPSVFCYRYYVSYMSIYCALFEAKSCGRQHIIIITIQMSVSLSEHTTVYCVYIYVCSHLPFTYRMMIKKK